MKKLILFGIIIMLCISIVSAWSYVKIGSVYVVTLDSGKKVNVTNVYVNNADKSLGATIITEKLTIQEAVNLKNITEQAYASLPGKKSEYTKKVLIIQK